jgi:ankyrin repeat protein
MVRARDNEDEIVRILIDAGADMNAKDKNGVSALMLALDTLHFKVVRILLSAGADTAGTDTGDLKQANDDEEADEPYDAVRYLRECGLNV